MHSVFQNTLTSQTLTAGGSIPAILGYCRHRDGISNNEPDPACLHQMLDERITRLSGTELQGLFERIFDTNPHLASVFFTGARTEIQVAIRTALQARLTAHSNDMAHLINTHADSPDYIRWQLSIMQPLSEYQEAIDDISPSE